MSLSILSVNDLHTVCNQLFLGTSVITHQDDSGMRIVIEHRCSIEGESNVRERFMCDLDAAIIGGAVEKLMNREVMVHETRCYADGDDRCEFEISLL